MMEIKTPERNADGSINIELNHPVHGWIPFTASPNDVEESGRLLYAEAIAGNFGPIADYVPPVE